MLISVKGRNVEITDALRRYAEKKIQKLEKYLGAIKEAHVTETVEHGQHVIEVQLEGDGFRLRGEERTDDMYASIDQVVEKLERRIHRFKGRIFERRKGEGPKEREAQKEAITQEAIGTDEAPSEEELPQIVRTKRFPIKPMVPEEAALEMELMHYDFYVFLNSDTEQANLVYKRRDGNYGLIEPEQ